jgi:hypothetical protein
MSSERGFLKTARVVLIAVVSWFVLNIVSELIGSQANETAFGQVVGRYVLLAAVFAVPVAAMIWLVLYLRDRVDEPAEPEESAVSDGDTVEWPAPDPTSWRPPDPVYGRVSEVDRMVRVVLDRGLVVVAGPRDIGTSAVAETVVQRLITAGFAQAGRTVRFDLRSRSSRRPDDARVAAARVVSAFGLDEPADGTPTLLADAGHRLVAALRERYDVLMLDNASGPEEIEWLARNWPAGGRPWLVVAGESAVARVVERATVLVGALDPAGLREMWRAEVPEPGTKRGRRIWERLTKRSGGPGAEDLTALLEACLGRPGVLKAFIREILRPDSTVSIKSVIAAASAPDAPDGVLERVWTEMLDHVRDGLPDDAVWLLHALSELPVTALTPGEVGALLAGRDGPPPDRDPLEELRIRNLVREANGRYRLPLEVRAAVTATTAEEVRRTYARQAVPALVGHHAAAARGQADRLGSGASAGDWFHDAERSLRPLFTPESYVDDELLGLVLDDLAAIADALEGWYVREQQSGGLLAVNEALYGLAERSGRPELAYAAAVRMATAHRMVGRLGDAGAKLGVAAACAKGLRHEQVAELGVRAQVERALLSMAGGDPEDLRIAAMELDRVLATHRDHGGSTAALINLGALCLRLDRPADALRHLRRAERLAHDRRDIGCRAHAIELRGIALSGQDDRLLDAVAAWRLAEHYFRAVGEEQGEARCLQHLGAAALVDPCVAGQIRDNRPHPLDEPAAAQVALDLLERAERLRAGQPRTRLGGRYLQIARDRLATETPAAPADSHS